MRDMIMQRVILRHFPLLQFEPWSFYLDHSEFGIMFSGIPTITFEAVKRSVSAFPVGLSTCP